MSTDIVTIVRHLPTPMDGGDLGFVNPDTGEALPARDATDHTILYTGEQISILEDRLREMKRVAAAVMRDRHGVGTVHSGGYAFKVVESQSWPQGPTADALRRLVDTGRITEADARRAMPTKPKPDATQLKALAGRLVASDPEAAKTLADACTKSPPSLRDIEREAVEGSAG